MIPRPQVGDTVEYDDVVVIGLQGGRSVAIPATHVGTVVRVGDGTVTLEVVDLDAEYPATKLVVVHRSRLRLSTII